MSTPVTLQEAINHLFPANTGISQGFGVNGEAGVDIAAPAGTAVPLFANSTYLGSLAGGYVAVFKEAGSGLIDYYQHIVSSPTLAAGAQYSQGATIGTIAPVSNTPAGYSTTGAHLEFGTASGFTAGAGFPTYSYANPTNQLIGLASVVGAPASSGGNWWDALSGIPGDIGNAAGTVAGNAATVAAKVNPITGPLDALLTLLGVPLPGNSSAVGQATSAGTNAAQNAALSLLGLPTATSIGASLRKWGLIILLSIGALLLVLELFRSEDH